MNDKVKMYKEMYPKGTRIELISMEDPFGYISLYIFTLSFILKPP